jgi:hypothetical protein
MRPDQLREILKEARRRGLITPGRRPRLTGAGQREIG